VPCGYGQLIQDVLISSFAVNFSQSLVFYKTKNGLWSGVLCRFFMSELCEDMVAVLPEPTFEEYVHALMLVAAEGESNSAAIRQFAAIFDHWALESERAGESGVRAFVAAADRAGLPRLAVVPTSRGGFAAPQSCLYIADDERTAALFQSARRARFVHRDLTQSVRRVAQLSELLALPSVSQAVRRETFPFLPRADPTHPLGSVVAAVLPLIQRWIFWSRPSSFDAAASVIEGILPLFKTLLCDGVDQTLQLGGDDPTLPQPCAAALDGPCFYVARKAAEDYHVVFKELARALLGGTGDADLATFAALLAHTVAANGNTEALMERAGLWQLFPCCERAKDLLARTSRTLPVAPWVPPPACVLPDTFQEAGSDMDLSEEEADTTNPKSREYAFPSSAGATAQHSANAGRDMQPWQAKATAKPAGSARQPWRPVPVWPPPVPGVGSSELCKVYRGQAKCEFQTGFSGLIANYSSYNSECEERVVGAPTSHGNHHEICGQRDRHGIVVVNEDQCGRSDIFVVNNDSCRVHGALQQGQSEQLERGGNEPGPALGHHDMMLEIPVLDLAEAAAWVRCRRVSGSAADESDVRPDCVRSPQAAEHRHDSAWSQARAADSDPESAWESAWVGGGNRSEARDGIGRLGEALVRRLWAHPPFSWGFVWVAPSAI
jgi:hypothetical protein